VGLVVELLLTASAAVLMLDSRLRPALAAYAVLTATTLWQSFPHAASPAALALFAALAAIKLVAGPLAIVALVRRYRVPEYLTPSFNTAWRVGFAALAVVAGHEAGRMTAFAHVPLAGAVFTAVFASVATVLLHRNLLAHVIGLLALGSAISLAGAVFAPGLSGAVELADTFDVVIATFVALAIARAILAYDPQLDVRSLRTLRG
jgi:hypothetical protein